MSRSSSRLRSRSRLFLTTSLSGAIAAAALALPSAAYAADECGTPAGGVVTCAPTGNPYGTGIRYAVSDTDPVQDLTIKLDDGVAIDASGDGNAGIRAINGSTAGALTVSGAGSTIHTSGSNAAGIFALNNNPASTGGVTVAAGDVSTSGYRSDGIYASTNYGGSGDVSITAHDVTVSGAASTGIVASTQTGDIAIDVAHVKASGDGGQGINAVANYGDLTINAGQVETSGTAGRGISAYSAGTTNVTVGSLSTTGAGVYGEGGDAGGIMAVGTAVNVNVSGAVSTAGDYAVGIYAHTNHVASDATIGNPDINVSAGSVSTQGFASDAIHAVNTAYNGDVNVTVGDVSTKGDYAWGVYAAAQYGNVAVKTGQVTTSGAGGTGIIALANGFVQVDAAGVTTTGDNAAGIHTQTGNAWLSGTQIKAGSVSTSGANSNGIEAQSIYGGSTIGVDVGTVSTQGDNSKGIYTVSAGGTTISAGEVTTSGAGSTGIYAVGYGGLGKDNIIISAGKVTTSGDQAHGIVALGAAPLSSILIDASHVATSGTQAMGIYANSRSGTVSVNGSDIHTGGAYSSGIVAVSTYGNVNVTADHVATDGIASTGIYAATNTGKATIAASDVKVGDYSTAIVGIGSSVAITTSGTIDTGYLGSGIYAHSTDGGITLHNDAAVSASYSGIQLTAFGQRSDIVVDGTGGVTKSGGIAHEGFGALNITGGNISITQGDITTSGSFSNGLVASIGNYANSPTHGSDTAHLFVDLQNVTTDGYSSSGVLLANDAVTGKAGTGDATAIVHGSVITHGMASVGIGVYSANDAARVQSNVIETAGDFSDGIHVDGESATVDAKGKIATFGNNALGIGAYAENGGIKISAGPIATTGLASTAIRATSAGDITISGTGPITTGGAHSAGIQVVEKGRHRELASYIPYGTGTIPAAVQSSIGLYPRQDEVPVTGSTISVAADSVATSGDASDGIFVSASTGTTRIDTGSVAVTGMGSTGIFAEDKAIVADTGNTSAAHGNAISLHAYDSAALNVRGAAVSKDGDAVSLQGSAVTLTVASGGGIQGAVNGVVIDATPHVTPVVRYWGQTPQYYYAPDQPLPPANPAPGKVTVSNAGTIVGGTGYAITITGGSAAIDNKGTIDGALKLGSGDDSVTNSGTILADKDSDFGAGKDLFRNSGTLRILGHAKTAGHVTMLGLEAFENSGLVDLRNGHTGDTLTLPGGYVGSGGAMLGLDFSAATGAADLLVVGGAATGSTGIVLDANGSAATLTSRPITLVKVGAGSAANAFTLATPDVGFVHYDLAFDAASGSFGLTSRAGAAVRRLAKMTETAQSIWRKSADAWSSHMAELRDGVRPDSRVWGQAYGGVDNRRGHEDGDNVGYRQDYYGFQAGLDLAGKRSDDGQGVVFGLTGGYLSSHVNFRAGADRVRFDTVDIGAYAGLRAGPLFANLLGQYDHYRADARNGTDHWDDSFNGNGYGAQAEIGARLGGDTVFAEPVASLAWQKTDLGTLHAEGQAIDFGHGSALTGKVGARIGGTSELGKGGKAVFYARAAYVHNFHGRGSALLESGGTSDGVTSAKLGSYGEGAVGVNLLTAGRLSGFIEGDADVGGGLKGGGGRVGIRFKL